MSESARMGRPRVDLEGERIRAMNVSPHVWRRPTTPSAKRLRLAGSEESGAGKLGRRAGRSPRGSAMVIHITMTVHPRNDRQRSLPSFESCFDRKYRDRSTGLTYSLAQRVW